MTSFSIAIICGGPSLERGVSLNSARSAMDHLLSQGVQIYVMYVSRELKFFHIENAQLYSNTPSDFDFKLQNQLDNPVKFLSDVDIVLPVIHGKYGEDGQLQKFLEENSIPFIGSSSIACKEMFSKSNVNHILQKNGFDTTKIISLNAKDIIRSEIEEILKIKSKVIVKPNGSGSSIGVSIATSYEMVLEKMNEIISENIDDTVIVEEYCQGYEFTVIVLENDIGLPVALIPTEIEILSENKLFDYRNKYLPTNATRWHCPPRFDNSIVKRIMSNAEKIFQLFNADDYIRIDGWLLEDGRLVFTDINPISGLEQNSFLFQQASLSGMTHCDLLGYILQNACTRYDLELPIIHDKKPTKNVFILLGGDSTERQVSLMSGTNIFLKLLNSNIYRPQPFLLDGDFVWYLPYQYIMSHTVEEIKYNCEHTNDFIENLRSYITDIRLKLRLYNRYHMEIPRKLTLNAFLDYVQSEDAFLFLGLHGGIGEDGTIQLLLEKRGIEFNGSSSEISRLCMNKYQTGQINISNDVISLPKILCSIIDNILINIDSSIIADQYLNYDLLRIGLESDQLLIKPCNDGCSAGIMKINSQEALDIYINSTYTNEFYCDLMTVPKDKQLREYIIEPLIEVDKIIVQDHRIMIEKKTGWVEMTVGVIEENGIYHSFNPSITIAENNILSLAEKFQGGTGINLTPPPEDIISQDQLQLIKHAIIDIGLTLRLENYARIDIFFNSITNLIILIEVNTLPALTPSTVIFHQALAEPKSMYPLEFLEKIISKKLIS